MQPNSWGKKTKTGTSTTLAESLMKLHLMAAFNKLYILAENSVVCNIRPIALNCVGCQEEKFRETLISIWHYDPQIFE